MADSASTLKTLTALAVSLILGRLLTEDEFPDGMADVLASASGISAQGASEPLPHGIRTWLSRALQRDQRHSFESAIDAQAELDKVLSGEEEDEGDYPSDCRAAERPDRMMKRPEDRSLRLRSQRRSLSNSA